MSIPAGKGQPVLKVWGPNTF